MFTKKIFTVELRLPSQLTGRDLWTPIPGSSTVFPSYFLILILFLFFVNFMVQGSEHSIIRHNNN